MDKGWIDARMDDQMVRWMYWQVGAGMHGWAVECIDECTTVLMRQILTVIAQCTLKPQPTKYAFIINSNGWKMLA